ncbi:MAG: 4-hydroxy-tetrahydrodipicolinate reductase [Terriglobales bacterium]
MNLILIGYGRMNRCVEVLAREQGHRVTHIVRSGGDWPAGWTPGLVAIDFSVAGAVLGNVERAMAAGIPIVIGATGWREQLPAVQRCVAAASVGAVYGANFSLGVQVFFRLVAAAAEAMPADYDAFITEAHHRHKKDAPSGTALRLRDLLAAGGRTATVSSVRAGAIPGTHTVGFDGAAETITLTHTARSREGFAQGALLAAQWILGRRGLHAFEAIAPELGRRVAGGQ